ncbi:MAG: hypothetical protein HY924_08640 [Elusimicrobia bacterium]|nr:hypothetical protein [Elusimicrobiota bacterium]
MAPRVKGGYNIFAVRQGGVIRTKIIVVLAAIAAGAAGWVVTHRELPDITEEAAKAIAEAELLAFCRNDEAATAIRPYFSLDGTSPSSDPRFRWSFTFLDKHADPWQKITVSVGGKGDRNVEYASFPAPPGAELAPGEALAGAPAPAPVEASVAVQEGQPGEAPASEGETAAAPVGEPAAAP